MLIYFLIFLILILCIADYIRNEDLLSPGFIFNAVWLVTLVLYQFKLSYIQQDLSSDTIFVFTICVVIYNMVIILTRMLYHKKDNAKIKNRFDTETKLKIANIIVVIIFTIEVIYSKGTPLIWKVFHINKSYFSFGIPSLNGLLYSFLMVLGAYAIFKKSKSAILYLIIGILVLSRQVILSIIIEGFICLFFSRENKINWWKLLITGIIIIFGFSILGNFRSGASTMDDVFQAKPEYEKLPAAIKWPYSYMTFSLSNFNNLVYQTYGFDNYGVSTLKEFLPTIILNKINIKENRKISYLVSPNYTVSTYLPSLYIDFSILGIALFNILISVLGVILYTNASKDRSDRNILLYSVFVHNIIFLFFSNMFLNVSVSFQFILILILINKEKSKIGG